MRKVLNQGPKYSKTVKTVRLKPVKDYEKFIDKRFDTSVLPSDLQLRLESAKKKHKVVVSNGMPMLKISENLQIAGTPYLSPSAPGNIKSNVQSGYQTPK